MLELKACPICGNVPKIIILDKLGGSNEYYISCKRANCIEQKHCYRSKHAAIAAWNKRKEVENAGTKL